MYGFDASIPHELEAFVQPPAVGRGYAHPEDFCLVDVEACVSCRIAVSH